MTKEMWNNILWLALKGFVQGLWTFFNAFPWWGKIFIIGLIIYSVLFTGRKKKRY